MFGFSDLFYGLSIVLTLNNLLYCFIGCVIGTLVGVLPGLGPVAAMSLLFPVTLHIPPVSALIMMAGIYYGAMYGGSTTSILVNIPGEAASVITCLDGYQMARKGRAGVALGMSALGSFIGGTLSIVGPADGRSPAGQNRAGFRLSGIFFPHVLRAGGPHLHGQRLHGQSLDDGRFWNLFGYDRNRSFRGHP